MHIDHENDFCLQNYPLSLSWHNIFYYGLVVTVEPEFYLFAYTTEDGTALEPASKFIRLEGEDGQSYLLAVTGVYTITFRVRCSV